MSAAEGLGKEKEQARLLVEDAAREPRFRPTGVFRKEQRWQKQTSGRRTAVAVFAGEDPLHLRARSREEEARPAELRGCAGFEGREAETDDQADTKYDRKVRRIFTKI
ncbi:hypothetical protein GW7_21601 [Heterocephalus glaber]|uniref:Uncharacterized protein n=1 Tax=Heterocephalus glaber TaxID=10181 RepID=G5BMK8_HETGA|nr:hypothetical protein GW7_21601 [Heterocephalus glaber]